MASWASAANLPALGVRLGMASIQFAVRIPPLGPTSSRHAYAGMRVDNVKPSGFQDFLGNGQKSRDHLGIELPPRLPSDFFPGSRVQKRGPIGAIRRHGVQGVGHGKYPGRQWNLIAPQTLRVARTIVAFMMG